jgi:uncharacterized Rossmann fold enzyme
MDIEIICNTDDAELFGNVEINSRTCKRWVSQILAHDGHAIIVGGGPSVADELDIIRKRHALGQKIFALNGAAKFLNKNNIIPEYQVILDARAGNIDLLGRADEYLIASQCHPTLFDSVSNITIWHPAVEELEKYLPNHDEEYAMIGGGTTVGLSTMCLAYTMGYRKLHLFGYDCSHRNAMGHAYKQKMNVNDILCKVTVNGKVFNLGSAEVVDLKSVADNSWHSAITKLKELLIEQTVKESNKSPLRRKIEKHSWWIILLSGWQHRWKP